MFGLFFFHSLNFFFSLISHFFGSL